jgi:hypothetical protein
MAKVIGKRSESICSTIINRYVDAAGFLLDPSFLGEKFPAVDFYVHLLNYDMDKAFLFSSVKTTSVWYTADNTKLKITVDHAELYNQSNIPYRFIYLVLTKIWRLVPCLCKSSGCK